MNIAIDVMGGDNAPESTILGTLEVLKSSPKNLKKIFLVGDSSIIKEELKKHNYITNEKIEIVHSSQIVTMCEPAVKSLKEKKDSSISVGLNLLKEKKCNAFVSAGNTGAVVATATIKLRPIKGVERAGIISQLPNENGVCNLIDTGANVEAKPMHLFHYAIMGHIYSKYVQNKKNPAVGLMSVGEEDSKGNEFTKEVFKLLKNSDLNFIGNVEGHDLFETPIDVIVCDGFTGNVILKSCEATAKAISKWLKEEINFSIFRKIGALLAKKAFTSVKNKTDYESYGGSPLLGLNGVCIIAHGSSSSIAIKNAILSAIYSVENEVISHIKKEINK